MKSEKMALTKIINTLKEKLPDGNDLWNYPGISKNLIIESLNQSYNFIGLLDDYEDQMEVIWAKRRLAKYFDDIKKLIDRIGKDKWEEEFDDLLEKIAKTRMLVKDIYVTLIDKPIRSDEEIQVAKDKLEELTEKTVGIETKITTINEGSIKADEVSKKIEAEEIKVTELIKEIDIQKTKNIESHNHIENIISKMNETQPEIDLQLKTTKELQKNQENNNDLSEKLIAEIKGDDEKIKQIAKSLGEQVEKDKKIQDVISQTLEDVNKYGMASSFLKRKTELGKTMGIWGVLSVISMGLLIYVSYNIASEMIKVENFDPIRNLFKIPSVIAGVWLCWFCIKQYGYTSRIREDYSYKCAISMAFEGYKNETRDVNPELLDKLLQMTISSIAINPVLLFDTKSNHGSPWNELMDGIKKILKIDAKVDAKMGL